MMTREFEQAAPPETIEAVAVAMRANGIDAQVVDTGEEARRRVLDLVPEGAQVHSGKSKTLEDTGLHAELHESGRYDSIRARYLRMDRRSQADEIRRLTAAPDFMVGSVHAVTEAGDLVTVSASGSQLGPYVSGAGRVILVVGSQKIVRDLDEALRRVHEHVFPWEDARLRKQYGMGSSVAKVVVHSREWPDGRTTVLLVREPVGV